MFRFAVSLLVLGLSATTWAGASFAESSSMKETAADRMMPREQAQKMRADRVPATVPHSAAKLESSSPEHLRSGALLELEEAREPLSSEA